MKSGIGFGNGSVIDGYPLSGSGGSAFVVLFLVAVG